MGAGYQSFQLSSAAIAGASPRARIAVGLHALWPGASAVGPTWLARCRPGDNRPLHEAMASAPEGAILICDAGGDSEHGYFGELMTREAKARGIAGLVINGAIRDSAVVMELGFPVFCRGFAARPCAKVERGRPEAAVRVGSTVVYQGDWVVADADGVAFVAEAEWQDVLLRAGALEQREREIKSAMARGERLAEILFPGVLTE